MSAFYLSPSGQKYNKYAYGNYVEEAVCRTIAELVHAYLQKYGHTSYVASPYNTDAEWKNRCVESDNLNADYHVCIHTNAGGGHGVRILCNPSRVNEDVMVRAKDSIMDILPNKFKIGKVVGSTDLYEINVPSAKTVYYEVAFHDNLEEAKWIVEHIEDIARAIVKGLTGKQPEKESDKIYRIQLGAFKDRANAEAYLKELRKKGIDAFIT